MSSSSRSLSHIEPGEGVVGLDDSAARVEADAYSVIVGDDAANAVTFTFRRSDLLKLPTTSPLHARNHATSTLSHI